jgi:hypothetical protein
VVIDEAFIGNRRLRLHHAFGAFTTDGEPLRVSIDQKKSAHLHLA